MKALIQSKTFWTNVLLVIIQMAAYIQDIAPEYQAYLVVVGAFANILLRTITDTKINRVL